jgi:ornithine decarboxylase
LTPQGTRRTGPTASYRVFGPTCDSIDQLNEPLELPATLSEGDYLLIEGCGAYSHALKTGFNGYGPTRVITMRPRSMGPTRVDDRAP